MPRTWVGKKQQQFLRIVIRVVFSISRFFSHWIPMGIQLRLGGVLGLCAYYFMGKERRRTLGQLQKAFEGERSPQERKRIARECFQNLGRTFFEVLAMDELSRNDIERIITFEGEDALKAATASGRGAIFVTGHIGNWEFLAIAVGMRCPLAVVTAPMYDPLLEEFLVGLRAAHGVETLVRDAPGSLRRLLTILRKGGMVGILMDQDTKVDGTFVPFFHQMAYTPTGAANLALRTGAAVVVGFIQREGLMHHRVMIHPPIRLASSGNLERDVAAGTAQFTKMIEDQVRRTPEQWVWMHRRWRTLKPERVS